MMKLFQDKKIIAAYKVVTIVLLVLWIGFIWGHSLTSVPKSLEQSSGFTEKISAISMEAGITESGFNDKYVRKVAHFLEFGFLGGLIVLAGWGYELLSKMRKPFGIMWGCWYLAIGGIVALVDELLQLTVEGRSCEFRDWCIDMAGVLIAIAGMALFKLLISKIAKSRKVV